MERISAELFRPAGAPNGAAVIIAHGSDGMQEPWASLIRDYARSLANNNYTVYIPNYLDKTNTAPGIGVLAQIPAKLLDWQAAVDGAIGIAATPRIGLLGFSLGGHLVLRLRHRAQAVVSFFAPALAGIGPTSGPFPPVQLHHGSADTVVDPADAVSLQQHLRGEGSRVNLFSYTGAGHGFLGDDIETIAVRRVAKDRTLAFIAKHV